MARLVLDTNVLVSAVIADGKPRILPRRCIGGAHTLLQSKDTLRELVDVLRRPKFLMAEEEVHHVLGAVAAIAEIIEPKTHLEVVKADPADDRFLELAVEGNADYLVSGDRHLLSLKTYGGVPIRRVHEILSELGDHG